MAIVRYGASRYTRKVHIARLVICDRVWLYAQPEHVVTTHAICMRHPWLRARLIQNYYRLLQNSRGAAQPFAFRDWDVTFDLAWKKERLAAERDEIDRLRQKHGQEPLR